MIKIKLVQKEEVMDAKGHSGTLYLIERIPGISEAVLKNGSFRPKDVGKSRVQSFMGGYIEATAEMMERIRDEVSEGSLYETIEKMKSGNFDKIYLPN